MDPEEYSLISEVECSHWWYKGLRKRVISELIGRVGEGSSILDAGCGTGGTLAALGRNFPSARVIGVDFSPIAALHARQKAAGRLTLGTVNALPFPDASFDIIVSLDVIYHAGVEENQALKEFMRTVKPGGLVLVHVPAYEWLRSDHDVVVHTARRYTAGNLRASAVGAGFEILKCGYRNSLLFPLMVLQRLGRKFRTSATPKSAVIRHGNITNTLLGATLNFENRLIRSGARFPGGGSVFAVLRKSSS